MQKIKGAGSSILILLLFVGLWMPYSAEAETGCYYGLWGKLEVLKFPLLGPGGETDICTLISSPGGGKAAVAMIIGQLVLFVTALVLMAAAVSIVIGGYIYMTAGGSADRVQVAKTWIIAALLGITIALTAWVMLNTISPTLI